MEYSFKSAFLLIHILTLFLQISKSEKTILVDGVTEWTDPIVVAGDTIFFKHRYNYDLFIFRSKSAFQLCNLTQATVLTKPNSTSFTWHPTRLGFFYFAFTNTSSKPCQRGQKLAIQVTLTPPPIAPPSPEPSPAKSPPPIHGSIVSPSPSFPWPFKPREFSSPSPTPVAEIASSPLPENGDGGVMPFINSNPAVALPTGAVDSATIRPVSTGHGGPAPQVVGFNAIYKVLCMLCAFHVAAMR